MALHKVLIVGSEKSGKSSLLLRAADDTFTDSYISTIGVDFKILGHTKLGKSEATRQSNEEKLQVWDTAGQARFKTITQSYYRGARAIILAVDLPQLGGSKQAAELERLKGFIQDIQTYAPESTSIYLVGTKQDLAQEQGTLKSALSALADFASEQRVTKGANIIDTFTTTSKPESFTESGNFLTPLTIFRRINDNLHAASLRQQYPDGEPGKGNPKTTGPAQTDSNYSYRDSTKPNVLSRFFGLIGGALLGAGTALLIHNPVACFLAAARAPYFAEWGHANWLRILLAPVVNPVMAVLYGLKDGAVFGAQNGITELAQIPKNENFKLRTVIGSFLVSALIVAAGIAASPLLSLALPIVAGIAGAAALITIASMGVDLLMSARELSKARKINSSLLANTDDARNAVAETLKVQPARQPTHSQQKGYGWALLNEYKNADRAQVDNPIKENLGQASQSYRSLRSWVNVAPRPPVTSAEQAQIASQAPQAIR